MPLGKLSNFLEHFWTPYHCLPLLGDAFLQWSYLGILYAFLIFTGATVLFSLSQEVCDHDRNPRCVSQPMGAYDLLWTSLSHTLPRPSVIRLENMCSAPIPSPHIIIRRFPRLGSKIRKFMRIWTWIDSCLKTALHLWIHRSVLVMCPLNHTTNCAKIP